MCCNIYRYNNKITLATITTTVRTNSRRNKKHMLMYDIRVAKYPIRKNNNMENRSFFSLVYAIARWNESETRTEQTKNMQKKDVKWKWALTVSIFFFRAIILLLCGNPIHVPMQTVIIYIWRDAPRKWTPFFFVYFSHAYKWYANNLWIWPNTKYKHMEKLILCHKQLFQWVNE